ncbi:MAG TPA: hypothetical protein PLH11_06600, partial [Gemmobacter sp.]|nr:hypothetical protein [Gemmobacter sp.]
MNIFVEQETDMQIFRADNHEAELVGWGVRVLMVSDPRATGTESVMRRVSGFGGLVDHQDELYAGLGAMLDDPTGYGLFVMLCDELGGLEVGQKAHALLRGSNCTAPIILISNEVSEQSFPEDRSAPILLRSPLSAVSMRVGFEHALRERLI